MSRRPGLRTGLEWVCRDVAAGGGAASSRGVRGGTAAGRGKPGRQRGSLQAGTPFGVGVFLRMQRGWHVYWLNPGESGCRRRCGGRSRRGSPPAAALAGPAPLRATGRRRRIRLRRLLLLRAVVTPPARGRARPLRAEVGWLACEASASAARRRSISRWATGDGKARSRAVRGVGARFPVDAGVGGRPAT